MDQPPSPNLPPDIVKNASLYEDRGPRLMAALWTLTSIAIVFQLIRFYVRRTIRQLGADDWWMFFTTAVLVGYSVICTVIARAGGEKHAQAIEVTGEAHVEYVRKLLLVAPVFSIMDLAFGKISVALLLLRFMTPHHRWQKWFLWCLMITTPIITSLVCILIFVQCDPPRALWDYNVPAKCWNPHSVIDFSIFGSVWSASTNIALALLPISIMRRMNMPPQRKLALCFIFGLGVLAGAVGIYKSTQLYDLLDPVDFTWQTYTCLIYTAVEIFLIITSGTLPTYSPLWELLMDHVPLHPRLAMSAEDRRAAAEASRKAEMDRQYLQLALPTNISSHATTEDASRHASFMATLRAARTKSRPGSRTIRVDKTVEVTWSDKFGQYVRKPSFFAPYSRHGSIWGSSTRVGHDSPNASAVGSKAGGSTPNSLRHGSWPSISGRSWGSRSRSYGSQGSSWGGSTTRHPSAASALGVTETQTQTNLSQNQGLVHDSGPGLSQIQVVSTSGPGPMEAIQEHTDGRLEDGSTLNRAANMQDAEQGDKDKAGSGSEEAGIERREGAQAEPGQHEDEQTDVGEEEEEEVEEGEFGDMLSATATAGWTDGGVGERHDPHWNHVERRANGQRGRIWLRSDSIWHIRSSAARK